MNSRSRARSLAVQALYQILIGQLSAHEAIEHTQTLEGFGKADAVFFDTLVHGAAQQRNSLEAAMSPHLDRPWAQVSPIEHCILLLGAFELQSVLDVPVRVVLNESIELAKRFGGTDGHRYVNGILHASALQLRPQEMQLAHS